MSNVPRSARPRAAFLLVCLIATSLVPAAAGWGAKGTWEPDTSRDVDDHWMFVTPDTSPGYTTHHVYFNGFVGMCEYPECTSLSPNSALLESSLHSEQGMDHVMLGVWKDCNADGFIGLGDQGLWEYRSELLVGPYATGICPVQAWDPFNRDHTILHNDGQWVHEYVPIQWKSWITQNGFNLFSIKDNASRVWVDGGLPEDDLGAGGGGGCWINPQPRGTFHNVGGLLYYGDCFEGYLVTDTIDMIGTDIKTPDVHEQEPATGQWFNVSSVDSGVGADGLGAGQISFSDDPRLQWKSHSILNVEPWGEESDASFVHAWDCSQGTQSIDADLTPAGQKPQHVTNVSSPAVGVGSPSGSLSGTANDTGAGLDQCYRRDAATGGRGGQLARAPYSTESDLANTGAVPGKSATTVFAPSEGPRPGGPASLADKRVPPDEGTHFTSSNDFWTTNIDGLGDAGTFRHTTYYAYVSPGAISAYGLTLPPGGTGSYGASACSGHSTGVWKGWNCDASQWYINPADYTYDPPRSGTLGPGPDGKNIDIGAKVGSPFNLRDIDCMDLAIGAQRDATTDLAPGLEGATPQNVLDYANNNVHDTMRATEETAAPYIQTVDPSYAPTDVVGGGNSHHC